MEKPKIKHYGADSYEQLKAYAEHLSNQFILNKDKLEGNDLIQAREELKYAWREAHNMATTVVRIYAQEAEQALNQVLSIRG